MLDAVTDTPHDTARGLQALGLMDCGRLPAPWYVVRHLGSDHDMVRMALTRMGVSTFLPKLRIKVSHPRHQNGSHLQEVPAFPGYIFAQWPSGFTWQRILSQPGILAGPSGIVRPIGDPYGEPLPMPESAMSNLLARAREGGVIEDSSVAPELPPIARGTSVRLTSGPFVGHMGLCHMSSANRVAVLLDVMGATRQVTARRRDVEPA